MQRKPARFYLAGILGRLFKAREMQTDYGFRISGNTRDMVGRYIYTFGKWEPSLSAFVRSRVDSNTHFHDLGTNIGYFSLLAASLGAKVNGFDASPEMAAACQRNLDRAGLPGRVQNVAIAAEHGELILYDRSGPTNTGSRSVIKTENAKVHAKVKAAPLNALIELDPSAYNFFKIDIEGAERPVLDEVLAWLIKNPDAPATIVAEIHHGADEIAAQFIEAGCTVKFMLNDYSFDAYRNATDGFTLVDRNQRKPGYQYETVIERR